MASSANVVDTTVTVEQPGAIPEKYNPFAYTQMNTGKRRSFRRTMSAFPSVLRTPASTRKFIGNLMQRSISNRQRAEIQLESLLNESEISLPAFSRSEGNDIGDSELSLEEVSKLLNTQTFIISRIVQALFRDQFKGAEEVKTLTRAQIQKLTRVLNSTTDVRALLFFMILDEDGDHQVASEEFIEFYEKYLSSLKVFCNERIQVVITVLLQKFKFNEKNRINYEDFYAVVSKDSTLLGTLSQFTVHPRWFEKPETSASPNCIQTFFMRLCTQQTLHETEPTKLSRDYLKDNMSRIVVFVLYILINIGLAIYVIIYRLSVTKKNVAFVVIARVGGMLLNFNCSFIIVLMLKRTILLIRTNRFLRKIIPVDDHIDFHKIVGRFIGFLSIMHTAAHLANFSKHETLSMVQCLFTTAVPLGLIPGYAAVTGVALCVILTIMIVFSMQWIRRGGHFQIFYWTHLLYLPFFVLLIIHCENFWKWIVGPLSLLLLEKIYSVLKCCSSRGGRTFIHSATIEQSNVISLTIHRPKHFHFRPGDYISINIPKVAMHEYHPFTISSAPEESNYIRVHIQACGNWTKQVYQRFKTMSENMDEECRIRVHRADLEPTSANRNTIETNSQDGDDPDIVDEADVANSTLSRVHKSKPREVVHIKGPYSSCARYIFDCKHVVLIGGGIGITPYASILSSLMAQFRSSRIICKNCNSINYRLNGALANRRLKKVDFIWINRDQKNFEWFLNLLRQFEEEQETYLASNPEEKRFLDIRLYFTEVKLDQNIGNAPLDLVTKVWAQIAGQDIFTSLKSRTRLGRPNWDEIFTELISGDNSATSNDVSVFFCGPPSMGNSVQRKCATYRFRYYEEKF